MLVYMPVIDGSGSTFVTNLLGELFKPNWYCHLDAESQIVQRVARGENLLVATGFWEGDEMVGPYVPIAKAEEWLPKANFIVCSIRQPINVLNTAATMGRPYERIVKSYLYYAKWSEQFNIFFLPVDIDKNFSVRGNTVVAKRQTILNKLMEHLGLPKNKAVQDKWAKEWPLFNDSKKFRPVRESGREARDFLIEHIGKIRPFLEKIGYRRLDWW